MNSSLFAFATFQGWTLAKWGLRKWGLHTHIKMKFALHGLRQKENTKSGPPANSSRFFLDYSIAVSNVDDVFDDFVHNLKNR